MSAAVSDESVAGDSGVFEAAQGGDAGTKLLYYLKFIYSHFIERIYEYKKKNIRIKWVSPICVQLRA